MFTFGREHEKKCEASYIRSAEQIPILMAVVDAVHDLIDGIGTEENVASAIRMAFIEGGAGVWEGAARWLRKCSVDYPSVLQLWPEFAAHRHADVRFRVACFLDEMPQNIYSSLSSILVTDRSKKVANMAVARVLERGRAA